MNTSVGEIHIYIFMSVFVCECKCTIWIKYELDKHFILPLLL